MMERSFAGRCAAGGGAASLLIAPASGRLVQVDRMFSRTKPCLQSRRRLQISAAAQQSASEPQQRDVTSNGAAAVAAGSADAAVEAAAAAAAAAAAPGSGSGSVSVSVSDTAAAAVAAATALVGPPAPAPRSTATLLIQCPDQPGVVAAVAQLLYGLGCNILQSDQFTQSGEKPTYFQRIEVDYSEMLVGVGNTQVLERAIAELGKRFAMTWRIQYAAQRKRVALLVSKLDHCLYDLVIRHRAGELDCEIPIVISNHADLEPIARAFGIEFRHLPLDKANGGKAAQETALEALLAEQRIDTIVLARYMQILSQGFCERHALKTINIHHSFLPAFTGAKPYHRAHERGVKVIGATAHFVTPDLDEGPIIAQDVQSISHRDSVADLVRKGRDVERRVLARALRWHLQDKVLVHGNKTVIFE